MFRNAVSKAVAVIRTVANTESRLKGAYAFSGSAAAICGNIAFERGKAKSAFKALSGARVVEEALNAATAVAAEVQARGYWRYSRNVTTCIANNYHLPILASIRSSEDQRTGYTLIPPQEYVKFDPENCRSKTVYVTIIAVDASGKKSELCVNLQKKTDYSVMVNKVGFVVDTKPQSIWERCHRY